MLLVTRAVLFWVRILFHCVRFELSAVVSDFLPVHSEHPLRTSPCKGEGLPQWGQRRGRVKVNKDISKTSLIKTYFSAIHTLLFLKCRHFELKEMIADHCGKLCLKQ